MHLLCILYNMVSRSGGILCVREMWWCQLFYAAFAKYVHTVSWEGIAASTRRTQLYRSSTMVAGRMN